MKIKFNWGTGIFIVIALFISFFTGFIIYSFSHDINLVSEEYFPEEITYEATIDKIKNTNKLTEKISLKVSDIKLELKFPDGFLYKDIKGTIHFFYVTDYKFDKKFSIQLKNDNKQHFELSNFKKGRYTIKIDWSYNNTEYYQEIKTTI